MEKRIAMQKTSSNGSGNGSRFTAQSWVSMGMVIILLVAACTWGATYRQVAINTTRIDKLESLAQSSLVVQAKQVEVNLQMTLQLARIEAKLDKEK
jgi:hypothetical protein